MASAGSSGLEKDVDAWSQIEIPKAIRGQLSRVLKTGYTKTGYMRSSWNCITAVSTRSLGPQKLKFNGCGRMFCHFRQTFTFLMTFGKKVVTKTKA